MATKLNKRQSDRTLHLDELSSIDGNAFVLIERMRVPHFTGARTVRWDDQRVVLERDEAQKLIEALQISLRGTPESAGGSK